MFPVPYIILAALILWKEFALWYYHRVMPPLLRAAMVVPGVMLAIAYVIFQFGEAYIPMEFRSAVARDILFVFFLWNGVFVYFTREQQAKVLERFWGALHRGGYLVLGRSEKMAASLVGRFELVNGRERIYKKPYNAERRF